MTMASTFVSININQERFKTTGRTDFSLCVCVCDRCRRHSFHSPYSNCNELMGHSVSLTSAARRKRKLIFGHGRFVPSYRTEAIGCESSGPCGQQKKDTNEQSIFLIFFSTVVVRSLLFHVYCNFNTPYRTRQW